MASSGEDVQLLETNKLYCQATALEDPGTMRHLFLNVDPDGSGICLCSSSSNNNSSSSSNNNSSSISSTSSNK
ncbi:hypothetical protein P8C59_003109 [Phyllachora maydis]|uniref:Uncharacterized protein n=1 Tax=Phyllachora maydis TaxID=1825666 RepID=A0AAD9M8U9_9PEZI|nr:hypothetical protein P8C59_003109 [Phyllachora maydis]